MLRFARQAHIFLFRALLSLFSPAREVCCLKKIKVEIKKENLPEIVAARSSISDFIFSNSLETSASWFDFSATPAVCEL